MTPWAVLEWGLYLAGVDLPSADVMVADLNAYLDNEAEETPE